jgi:hypothetical protein
VPGTHQARVHLQANTYDVILCEYHFGPESGQDLPDEIRYAHGAVSTVFFMVTGEATYERVAEVVRTHPTTTCSNRSSRQPSKSGCTRR